MNCIFTLRSALNNSVMLLALVLSTSCAENNMSNGKIIEISNISATKIKGEKLCEEPGALKIDVTPDYLLYTMCKGDYFLKIVNKKSLGTVGEFCLKGNGPNEFIAFDIVNQNTKDKIIIQDYVKNTIYEFDLENSIQNGQTILCDSYSLPDRGAEMFQGFVSTQGDFVVKEFDPAQGRIGYYSDRLPQFIGLYKEQITTNHLNQIMTLADGYEVASNKIVSLSGNNQIDVICIDNPANNISLLAKGGRRWSLEDFNEQGGEDKSFYASLPRFNDKYIVLLYFDKGKSEYHITNWDGDFLKRIEVDETIRDFNVDWPNKKIYGITIEDIVLVYEMSQI